MAELNLIEVFVKKTALFVVEVFLCLFAVLFCSVAELNLIKQFVFKRLT